MTWYKTGTVAVTPGSNAVIGTSTSFIANSRVGDAFRGPDGAWYEVTNIASDTALSIAPDYQGAAVSGGAYSLAPMQGYVKESADQLRAATKVIDGTATDMSDQVAKAKASSDSAALSAQSATGSKDSATQSAQQASLSASTAGSASTSASQSAASALTSKNAAKASEDAAKASADRAEGAADPKEAVLTGFTLPTVAASPVNATDKIMGALAKLQWQYTGFMAPTIANLSAPTAAGPGWTTSGTTNPVAGFPAGSQSYTIASSAATEFTQLLFSRSTPMRVGARRMTSGALQALQEFAMYPAGTTVLDAANLPVMVGATATAAGKPGVIPPGAAGDQEKFLTAGGVYKEAGGAGLPVGAIVPWSVSRVTLPAGWIARDGQLLNRADWPDLWALVSATAVTDAAWLAAPYDQRGKYSSGNGTTTFRAPDTNAKHADGNTIAAMFLRGDGKNSAGTPGLHQADQVQGFRMGPLAPATSMLGLGAGSAAFGSQGTAATVQASTGGPVTDGVNGTPRIGSETRPSSETVIWCTVGAGKAINPGSVDVTALATTVSGQSNQLASLSAQVADMGFGYSSAALAIVPGGVVTLNHGLGSPPQKFWIEATCTVADFGYAVGTVIRLSEAIFAVSGNNYGCTVEITSTQITVNVGTSGYLVIRKDNKVIERLTPTSWTVRYKASKS